MRIEHTLQNLAPPRAPAAPATATAPLTNLKPAHGKLMPTGSLFDGIGVVLDLSSQVRGPAGAMDTPSPASLPQTPAVATEPAPTPSQGSQSAIKLDITI